MKGPTDGRDADNRSCGPVGLKKAKRGMYMLKLKNVSKFYYSNGVITSGFSRVNLELSMGEFVVITGESGSGKSTLLNVLSGLDTYEEGEMYINGQETSHYNEADFEEYRRKYVGNIFQNFNLVNSYTVYQNVELALLLNGESKKEARDRVMDIIEKVGLSDFAGTKCAKLSGGPKQRVAIARALAKETPIIVADEPTGNLDSKSAEDVISLLSQISKDKLVIIVTHNLEQVEKYATRLIKMHDGKILEDKVIAKPVPPQTETARRFSDITAADRIRIGARNAFNIPAKFVLIFAVFLFVVFAVAGTYSSFQKMAYEESIYGYSQFFSDSSDSRIVINKEDRSAITEDELAQVEALDNVSRVSKNDMLTDYTESVIDQEGWYWFYGNFFELKDFDGQLAAGRMPENDNEIILLGDSDDAYFTDEMEDMIGKDLYIERYDPEGMLKLINPMKVVGVAAAPDSQTGGYNRFYVGSSLFESISRQIAAEKEDLGSYFEGQYFLSTSDNAIFQIIPNSNVPEGEAYVSNMLGDMTSNGECIGKNIEISVDGVYDKDSVNVRITRTYNKNNFSSLLGEEYNESINGAVYVNEDQYDRLVNKGYFQSSVYVEDVKKLDDTISALNDMGFKTLAMRDALADEGIELMQMITLMKTFMLAVLIIALFFISYFIIRIVLKSRNAYYTTLRTLGASRKISRQLLDIELFLTATMAYALFMAVMALVYAHVITQTFVVDLAGYLTPGNYVAIYIIIIAMSYMISHRFARKLFRDSVMNTYREEA